MYRGIINRHSCVEMIVTRIRIRIVVLRHYHHLSKELRHDDT